MMPLYPSKNSKPGVIGGVGESCVGRVGLYFASVSQSSPQGALDRSTFLFYPGSQHTNKVLRAPACLGRVFWELG